MFKCLLYNFYFCTLISKSCTRKPNAFGLNLLVGFFSDIQSEMTGFV